MLSDSIRQMRELIRSGVSFKDMAGIDLALHAYELEAANLESRVQLLSGRAHVPLGGSLVSAQGPVIEISGAAAR